MILVRHAHAGSKSKWDGPDELRPLSDLGRRQAESLVTALAAEPVEVLWSSPTARCEQTLAPLARARGLTVTRTGALAPDAPVEELLRWLLDAGGQARWALCTHGEVLDALHEAAVRTGVRQLVPKPGTEKGGAWIVPAQPDDVAVPVPARPPRH